MVPDELALNIPSVGATTSEKGLNLTTSNVSNPAVQVCDQAPAPSEKNSPCTEDDDAEWAREEAEEEALLYQTTRKLCNDLWPTPDTLRWRLSNYFRQFSVGRALLAAPKEPIITRMPGGDLNHIMSIALPASYTFSKDQEDLILRIPRWDDPRVDRDVAILKYARQHTDILLPTVIRSDFTSNNALEKPYALQRRVPGSNMSDIWDHLDLHQRCQLASQLGQINRTLRSVKSPVAGLIEARDDNTFTIIPFEIDDEEQDGDGNAEIDAQPRTPQSILDVFLTQYSRWFAVDNVGIEHVKTWPRLLDCVREMDRFGCFDGIEISLCHVDLHQRNVMVFVDPVDSSANITAVLDWDEAVFAPQFVQCEPPTWMWRDEDAVTLERDQVWPYEMPGLDKTAEGTDEAEIKRVFEESAGGAEYRKLAYDESFRLARGLWRIAKDGFQASHYVTTAKRMLRDWAILKEKISQKKAERTGCANRGVTP